jgi:hypothetical protein
VKTIRSVSSRQHDSANKRRTLQEGKLLAHPFGPRQVAFKFSRIVGPFDSALGEDSLEFSARRSGKLDRFAERHQAACVQSYRHFLRHLGLRRLWRQVDFLQNTIRNLKCQRHSKTITASTQADKFSTGLDFRRKMSESITEVFKVG